MANPVMKKAPGNGVKLQLAVWGGKGKTILCIHGLTANCRCWDTIASALSKKYRVAAVDLRGRGRSDKPETGYSVQHHCRDIHSLLDSMKLSSVILMGHSLGAVIALDFAAKYPERVERLILVDGAGKLTKRQTLRVFAGIKPSLDRLGRVYPSYEAYSGALKQAPFFKPWTPALEAYFLYEIEKVRGGVRSRVNPAHIGEEIMNLGAVSVSMLYSRVRCPTLILRAPRGMLSEKDILLPKNAVKRMAADIPEVWLADIKNANHYSIVFNPDTVRDRVILNFLDS